MPKSLDFPKGIADLIVKLINGANAPTYRPEKPRKLLWGNDDISPNVTRLACQDSRLVVEQAMDGFRPEILNEGGLAHQKWGHNVQGELADGTRLRARHAFMTRSQITRKETNEYATRITLEISEWEILPHDKQRIYWVSPVNVPGNFNAGVGNLMVHYTRGNSGMASHCGFLRFDSEYAYHLFKNGSNQWYLLLDSATRLDRTVLYRDLLALSYCMGGWVCMDSLTALNEAARPIGAFGVNPAGGNEAKHFTPPVTEGSTPWIIPLFNAIAKKTVDCPMDSLQYGMRKYLASLGPAPLESMYYEVMSGLEGISRAIVAKSDSNLLKTPLAKSIEEARTSLSIFEDAAEAIGLEKDATGQEILQKLLQPTKRMFLEAALDSLKQIVPTALLAEMDWYQFQFGEGYLVNGKEDAERGAEVGQVLRRVCDARMLLVAMLAKLGGYSGPLADRKPDWWICTQDSGSIPTYRLSTEVDEVALLDWPTFRAPGLPETPLVEGLARFAAKLESRTNGEIVGSLQPLPTGKDEGPVLEFKLVLREQPSTQVVLFTVITNGITLEIQGWAEETVKIDNAARLTTFCEEIANSGQVKKQAEEMMILASEIRRLRHDKAT